jgi:hypothetical protein
MENSAGSQQYFYDLNQAQNQYPSQDEKENGGEELNCGCPLLEEKGKLFRGDPPVDDPEDDQQWKDVNKVIQNKVQNGAPSE